MFKERFEDGFYILTPVIQNNSISSNSCSLNDSLPRSNSLARIRSLCPAWETSTFGDIFGGVFMTNSLALSVLINT